MIFEIFALLILVAGSAFIIQKFVRRVTVFDYECGLMYEHGRFSKLLKAGSYWYNAYHTDIRKIDMRPHFQTIPSQEVLTNDGVAIKLSMTANIAVTTPELTVSSVSNYKDALYLVLQLALRQVIGTTDIDQLLEKRNEIGKEIHKTTHKELEGFGLKLISIDIKDITFPGSLKQTFSQIVKARHEGLAALERARAESAALRSLANSAKLIEKNPALMNLRMIQSFNESSGNTLVLNLSSAEQALSKGETKEAAENTS